MNVGATLPGSVALSAGEIRGSDDKLFITSVRVKVGTALPGSGALSSGEIAESNGKLENSSGRMSVGSTLPSSGALSAGEIGESNGRLFITSGRMKVGSTLRGFANTSSKLPGEMPWAWATGWPSPATENRTAKVRAPVRLEACSLLMVSMGRAPHTAGPHTQSKLKPHIGFHRSNPCGACEGRR